jgi:hypothetical protein
MTVLAEVFYRIKPVSADKNSRLKRARIDVESLIEETAANSKKGDRHRCITVSSLRLMTIAQYYGLGAKEINDLFFDVRGIKT